MEEVQNVPDRNHSSNVPSILRSSDYDRDVAHSSHLPASDFGVRFLDEVDQDDQNQHSLSIPVIIHTSEMNAPGALEVWGGECALRTVRFPKETRPQ